MGKAKKDDRCEPVEVIEIPVQTCTRPRARRVQFTVFDDHISVDRTTVHALRRLYRRSRVVGEYPRPAAKATIYDTVQRVRRRP